MNDNVSQSRSRGDRASGSDEGEENLSPVFLNKVHVLWCFDFVVCLLTVVGVDVVEQVAQLLTQRRERATCCIDAQHRRDGLMTEGVAVGFGQGEVQERGRHDRSHRGEVAEDVVHPRPRARVCTYPEEEPKEGSEEKQAEASYNEREDEEVLHTGISGNHPFSTM